MSGMEIDSIDDRNHINSQLGFDSKVHLSKREDKETVRKAKALDIGAYATAFSGFKSFSLAGRAEKGIPAIGTDLPAVDHEPILSPQEQLMDMDPEALRAIEKELIEIKNNPPEPNYMIRVQTLIGKILAQFIRIAEKERVQKEDQKGKYSKSNKEWGNLQREIGDRGLNFTWIALGLLVTSQFLNTQGESASLYKEIVPYLAKEGCTNLSNMFNTETQSKQKQVEAIAQLALAEINAMMNKGSSDSSSKQEIIALLDKILQALKEAARAG